MPDSREVLDDHEGEITVGLDEEGAMVVIDFNGECDYELSLDEAEQLAEAIQATVRDAYAQAKGA